jgi:hypothetical protein
VADRLVLYGASPPATCCVSAPRSDFTTLLSLKDRSNSRKRNPLSRWRLVWFGTDRSIDRWIPSQASFSSEEKRHRCHSRLYVYGSGELARRHFEEQKFSAIIPMSGIGPDQLVDLTLDISDPRRAMRRLAWISRHPTHESSASLRTDCVRARTEHNAGGGSVLPTSQSLAPLSHSAVVVELSDFAVLTLCGSEGHLGRRQKLLWSINGPNQPN